MSDEEKLRRVSPRAVLERVARAIPEDCRANIIIIGSLAVGYHFFGNDPEMLVHTKDIDCLLAPHVQAIPVGRAVTERLFGEGWTYRVSSEWPSPGDENTPEDRLPVVRLNPPGSNEWFVELLAVPESSADRNREFSRLETSAGHFVLPSYGFLSIPEYKPVSTDYGICIARPEMMALANLLEHPTIDEQTMSTPIGGRVLKRSNKDLGRVLAISRLSDGPTIENWPQLWMEALRYKFGNEWSSLALRTGQGMRQLLGPRNAPDFEEARHSCEFGLLVSQPPQSHQLRATGERLVEDAIVPFEKLARA
jgi:hypothetical protein